MKRTFWPTLHLWRVILFSVTRNEALLFGSASSELLLAQSYYWQGCSDLLNLSSCLPRPRRSSSSTKLILSPSLSDQIPAASSAFAWTNTSLLPHPAQRSRSPFAVLKNFMVNVTRMRRSFPSCTLASVKRAARSAQQLSS